MSSKLKALKGILRAWNKEVFGRVDLKKEALSRISFWDDVEKEKELSLEEAGRGRRLERIIRSGLIWKRSPGDRNPEKSG